MSKDVAVLIFDDVEVLDFADPFKVFNLAGEVVDPRPFRVYTSLRILFDF